MTENRPKRLTYIPMQSSISPPDSSMHAIDKLIVSGGRMSYNQGRRDNKPNKDFAGTQSAGSIFVFRSNGG